MRHDRLSRAGAMLSLLVVGAMLTGFGAAQLVAAPNPRLSIAVQAADPVARYGLGRDATRVDAPAEPAPPAVLAWNDAPSPEPGTYRHGARVLVPYEPARKRERMRDAYYAAARDWAAPPVPINAASEPGVILSRPDAATLVITDPSMAERMPRVRPVSLR